MQRRQDECTAAISTRALKESDGPSYFHLVITKQTITTQIPFTFSKPDKLKLPRFILKTCEKGSYSNNFFLFSI